MLRDAQMSGLRCLGYQSGLPSALANDAQFDASDIHSLTTIGFSKCSNVPQRDGGEDRKHRHAHRVDDRRAIEPRCECNLRLFDQPGWQVGGYG